MRVILNKIDAMPMSEFNVQVMQWFWILVDASNENIAEIENAFNRLTAPHYTQTEIAALDMAGQLDDGIVFYDTTNNVYVGREAGVLVKFSTAAYP